RMLTELGEFPKASALADELGAQLEQVPQAQSKLIAGEISLRKNKNVEAVQLLQSAIGASDLWLARYDLGRAYLAAKAFPQADSEFVRCVSRQGEASDAFLDEMPTFHYLPPVFDYQGLVREGQGDSAGAREMFRKFLALKNKTASDTLVSEARKKLD